MSLGGIVVNVRSELTAQNYVDKALRAGLVAAKGGNLTPWERFVWWLFGRLPRGRVLSDAMIAANECRKQLDRRVETLERQVKILSCEHHDMRFVNRERLEFFGHARNDLFVFECRHCGKTERKPASALTGGQRKALAHLGLIPADATNIKPKTR